MSYSIKLKDPVTNDVAWVLPHRDDINIHIDKDFNPIDSEEATLNITYNYSEYYYEVMKDGVRSIYGLTGAESVSILLYMIETIRNKYCPKGDGNWIKTTRTREVFVSEDGKEVSFEYILNHFDNYKNLKTKIIEYIRDEGDTTNYWDTTAANAIKPLCKLLSFAMQRPDGIWEGD